MCLYLYVHTSIANAELKGVISTARTAYNNVGSMHTPTSGLTGELKDKRLS